MSAGELDDGAPDPRLADIELTGPIANGTRANAFGAPAIDLAEHGYVVEEYFLAGEVTAYEPAPGVELDDGTLPDDGRWSLLPARMAPFTTRIMIVRPAAADDFS